MLFRFRNLADGNFLRTTVVSIVVVLGCFSIYHQMANPKFDIVDEEAHFDYVQKVQHFGLPSTGEVLSQETLRVIDCTRSWADSTSGTCGKSYRDAKNYPAQGFSYESQQPPIAYIPFAVTDSILHESENTLLPYRLGGLFWYLIAMLLVLFFVNRKKMNFYNSLIFSTFVFLSPILTHAFATINNDAIGLPIGLAFITLPLLHFKSPKSKNFSIRSLGIFMGLAKAIFLILPLSAVCVLGYMRLIKKKEPEQGYYSIRNLSEMLLCGGLSTVGFEILQSSRSSISPSVVLRALQGFSLTDYPRPGTVLSGILNNLHIYSSYSPGHLVDLLFVLFIGILAITSYSEISTTTLLTQIFLFGAISLSIIWVGFNYVAGKFNFDSQTRYMIIFIPLISQIALEKKIRISAFTMSGILILLSFYSLG